MSTDHYPYKIVAIYPNGSSVDLAVVDTAQCQKDHCPCLLSVREEPIRVLHDRRLPPAEWLDRRFRFRR